MMTSKQEKRWQTKKLKVEAFMQMARLNSGDVTAEKLRKRQTSETTDETRRKTLRRNHRDDPWECHGDDPETTSSEDGETNAVVHSGENGLSDKETKTLTAEELAEVRAKIKARQNAGLQKPKFYLTLENLAPVSCQDPTRGQHEADTETDRSPLFVLDLQHLLLYAVQGNLASYKPRWCKLLRWTKVSQTVVIILEGVGADDYRQHYDWFPFLHQQFDAKAVEMISPSQYGVPVAEELFKVPRSWTQTKKACREEKYSTEKTGQSIHEKTGESIHEKTGESIHEKTGESIHEKTGESIHEKTGESIHEKTGESIHEKTGESIHEKTGESIHEKLNRLRDVISVLLPTTMAKNLAKDPVCAEKVSRRDLMLNSQQLIQEAYPMPIYSDQFRDFVYSREDYSAVTNTSPLFAIDCEMCVTTLNQSELTRVSVINDQLETLYDTLVKPRNRIINYLTRFSGITRSMLKDVTTTLEEAQSVIQSLLPPDAILCGQSLNGDLRALKMFHPYVIDTSVIYNLNGNRIVKPGLKKLSHIFLGKNIQMGRDGHDSVEDAASCMELVKLKLKHGKEFGDVILGGMIYPTADLTKHKYQDENSSSHAPLPETSTAALVAETKQQTSAGKTRSEHNAGVSESTSKADCLSGVSPGGADRSDNVDRKRVFFQRPGSSNYDSFFTIAKENKKSVTLVDRPDFLSNYVDETGVTAQSVSSDKEAVRKTKTYLWEQFLVCTHLRSFNDSGSTAESDMEATVRKLDKRVRKLLAHVGENALVTVLLGGRGSGATCQNALCFTKIT